MRGGTTAIVAVLSLVIIVVVAFALELRGGGSGERRLLQYAESDGTEPMDLIGAAGRAHRLVLLGDLPGAAAPKRLAAEAIERLAVGPGLDAVALDVGADQQQWIDQYLRSDPEDVSILLSHPRTLHDEEGTARAYLEIYRAVWRVNREMTADRRIAIAAIDLEDWPPRNPLSPATLAVLYARRDSAMVQALNNRILRRDPRARVLFFVDALHVLRGGASIQVGGTTPLRFQFLAERLRRRFPQDVYSIIVDAPAGQPVDARVARFRGTAAYRVLRRDANGPSRLALRAAPPLDVSDDMIRLTVSPGLVFVITPPDARFSDLVDAYIFLGG